MLIERQSVFTYGNTKNLKKLLNYFVLTLAKLKLKPKWQNITFPLKLVSCDTHISYNTHIAIRSFCSLSHTLYFRRNREGASIHYSSDILYLKIFVFLLF